MEHSPKQASAILAHWIYTREEWKTFTRLTQRRKSLAHYLLHFILPKNNRRVPEVIISSETVRIGDGHRHFSNTDHQLMRINIREEGTMNIMEITYEWLSRKIPGPDEICVPIPKGKLMEAIKVQKELIRNC